MHLSVLCRLDVMVKFLPVRLSLKHAGSSQGHVGASVEDRRGAGRRFSNQGSFVLSHFKQQLLHARSCLYIVFLYSFPFE